MKLKAELIMRLEVIVDKPKIIGKTLNGELIIIPIIGGDFDGPKIKGKVCPGGADWNTRINEKQSHVFAKYWIETDDGEIISIENEGIVNIENNNNVIITTPKFSVKSDGRYSFLADGVYVGELKLGKNQNSVEVTIYKMN